MTINAPAALLLLCYELAADEQGVPRDALRGTVQNDVLKEYVARGNYIFPPRPSMRLTTDLFVLRRAPPLEHGLDLRLPHPRGGLDGRAGAGVHPRERHCVLRGCGRGRALARLVRRAPLVLLQRAQRRAPGGGEVPRGAAHVGASCAGASLRPARGAGAPLPRPDRRLDAHGPAAREQPRARRRAGRCRRLRRRLVGPTNGFHDEALALPRATSNGWRAHAADPHARGGHDGHRRSARRLLVRGGAHRQARGAGRRLIGRIDETGGAVAMIEAGWVQQQIRKVHDPLAARWRRASA